MLTAFMGHLLNFIPIGAERRGTTEPRYGASAEVNNDDY
jgi:hypothetical protein